MMVILISLAVISTILSVICLVYCIQLNIKVVAMEKSTHKIQYVPVDQAGNLALDENGFELVTEETKKKFEEDELN